MKGIDYYSALNDASNQLFVVATKDSLLYAKSHDLVVTINDWYLSVEKYPSSILLMHAMETLDSSCLQILHGFYRAGFSSLRLSLEMILASVYFSAFHLEFVEWEGGSGDVVWGKLVDIDNGVFSNRFCNAFFKELVDDAQVFSNEAKSLYRKLSEMVHGNSYTWDFNTPRLEVDFNLIRKYEEYVDSFIKVINFILFLRFSKEVSPQNLERLKVHINDSISHIQAIRVFIGGQK